MGLIENNYFFLGTFRLQSDNVEKSFAEWMALIRNNEKDFI